MKIDLARYIYLVRHGQSEGNLNKKVYETKPDYAISLTEKGKEEAYNAGQKLAELNFRSAPIIWSSTFNRARETAKIITSCFDLHCYKESALLREQEWRSCLAVDLDNPESIKGDLEKERDEYGRFYFRFPNGESCADCYNRACLFEAEMKKDIDDFNLIIVSHGMFIRVLLMKMLNMTPEDFELLKNPKNCQIIKLEAGNGCYKLLSSLEKHEKLLRKY